MPFSNEHENLMIIIWFKYYFFNFVYIWGLKGYIRFLRNFEATGIYCRNCEMK